MKKTILLITCILAGSIALAYGPRNQDCEMGNREGNQYQRDNSNNHKSNKNFGKELPISFIKELNLSVDQLKQIEKIKEKADVKSRDLFKESANLRFELRKAIDEDSSNPSDVVSIRNKILTIQEQLLDIHVQSMQEHRKILTKEQKDKLSELLKKREKEMLERKFSKNWNNKRSFDNK